MTQPRRAREDRAPNPGAAEVTEELQEPSVAARRVWIEYIDLARRRAWVVVVAILLGISGAFLVTELISPTYEAKASLFVGSLTAKNQAQATAILYNGIVSENLARSYAVFAESTRTLRRAELELGRPIPPASIDAAPIPGSQILEIRGTAANAERAARRANAVADALVSTIDREGIRPEAKLSVVQAAVPPSDPIRPKLGLNLLLGAFAGLLLGWAAALAWERLGRPQRL